MPAPAAVIAAWLGHTDARFTLSVYAHADGEALDAAAASLGKVTGDRAAAGAEAATAAVEAAVAALGASGGGEAAQALAAQLETAVAQLRGAGEGDG